MPYYNYYNQYPYNSYQPSQSSSPYPVRAIEWVDGEVGAKAFQMPQGWPADTPIALWDNSEKRIWLKSWNTMGMPNPMQEINYTIKEQANPVMLPGVSGDMGQYATKKDFDDLKEELQKLAQTIQNNNNRGNNR